MEKVSTFVTSTREPGTVIPLTDTDPPSGADTEVTVGAGGGGAGGGSITVKLSAELFGLFVRSILLVATARSW